MIRFPKNDLGFSIIELIMVMSLLGLFVTFGVTKYPGVQRSARDDRRRSDLKQYQVALESYANRKNGLYPSHNDETHVTDLCTEDMGLSNCPIDPRAGSNNCRGLLCNYYFRSNGSCNDGTACASKYVLYSRLERDAGFWIFCSNGTSVLVPEGSVFTDGNCPANATT